MATTPITLVSIPTPCPRDLPSTIAEWLEGAWGLHTALDAHEHAVEIVATGARNAQGQRWLDMRTPQPVHNPVDNRERDALLAAAGVDLTVTYPPALDMSEVDGWLDEIERTCGIRPTTVVVDQIAHDVEQLDRTREPTVVLDDPAIRPGGVLYGPSDTTRPRAERDDPEVVVPLGTRRLAVVGTHLPGLAAVLNAGATLDDRGFVEHPAHVHESADDTRDEIERNLHPQGDEHDPLEDESDVPTTPLQEGEPPADVASALAALNDSVEKARQAQAQHRPDTSEAGGDAGTPDRFPRADAPDADVDEISQPELEAIAAAGELFLPRIGQRCTVSGLARCRVAAAAYNEVLRNGGRHTYAIAEACGVSTAMASQILRQCRELGIVSGGPDGDVEPRWERKPGGRSRERAASTPPRTPTPRDDGETPNPGANATARRRERSGTSPGVAAALDRKKAQAQNVERGKKASAAERARAAARHNLEAMAAQAGPMVTVPFDENAARAGAADGVAKL